MSLDPDGINTISPLDGRYARRVQNLATHFSEFALTKYRAQVEIEYLVAFVQVTKLQELSVQEIDSLRKIYENFSTADALQVKRYEVKCLHDVKSIEYFLQDQLDSLDLSSLIPYVHFGLTSEDINSLAYGLMLEQSKQAVVIPELGLLIFNLLKLADTNADVVMMGRTHGQPAVPTTLGKEIVVFASRLEQIRQDLLSIMIEGKCDGAVGNWHVHQLLLPEYDWLQFSCQFVTSLGLQPSSVTTQIIPAETYSSYFQALIRLDQIMIDCARDCWQYISDGYLRQAIDPGEVGSSTMPQKVNPIDFENAEGNAGIATALFEHFVEKLPISRLQRDLSDSTVKRSIGTAVGHCLLAIQSLEKGLTKVEADPALMISDVRQHSEMLAEAVQSALRLDGRADAYELTKEQSRGRNFDTQAKKELAQKISDKKLRHKIQNLDIADYTGLSSKIASAEVARITKLLTKVSNQGGKDPKNKDQQSKER